MLKKIEFNLLYFNVRSLDIVLFRKEFIDMFNDNINYEFRTNFTYYLNLLNTPSYFMNKNNSLAIIPFTLISKEDKEEYIEELFFQLYPFLQKILKDSNNNYPCWFELFIAPFRINYVNTKYFARYKEECLNHNNKIKSNKLYNINIIK